MDAKTIKQNMTQGVWSGQPMWDEPMTCKCEDGTAMTHNTCYIKSDELVVCDVKLIEVHGGAQNFVNIESEFLANIPAICYAINSTYGAGWDATKVPKAFEYLADIAAAELCDPKLKVAIQNFLKEAKL